MSKLKYYLLLSLFLSRLCIQLGNLSIEFELLLRKIDLLGISYRFHLQRHNC